MLWIILILIVLLFVAASRMRRHSLQPAVSLQRAEHLIQHHTLPGLALVRISAE